MREGLEELTTGVINQHQVVLRVVQSCLELLAWLKLLAYPDLPNTGIIKVIALLHSNWIDLSTLDSELGRLLLANEVCISGPAVLLNVKHLVLA